MNYINQMEPWFGDEERNSINDYFNEGGWITEFKRTKIFEDMIAEYTGAKYCIVVNNGTISLTLAAMVCGIEAGDEIIVPNYTMIATPNSVKMIGAVPIFVDVEPETLCLDIEKVKKAVTSKTKAIIMVSANGRYPKAGIKVFEHFCRDNGFIFMEDAAQALGSFYPDGRHIGSVATVGSFSFSAPKVISTGQGGALITNDDKVAFKLRRIKDFGRSGGGTDTHDSIGYNFKFTELQACVGIEQIKKLVWRVKRKKEIMTLYRTLLKDVWQVKFYEQDLKYTTPWFIDVQVENRDRLQIYLKENNIGTRVMYPPINKQKCYQLWGEYEISNIVGAKGLWLPSASQLSNDQINYVCEKTVEFYA